MLPDQRCFEEHCDQYGMLDPLNIVVYFARKNTYTSSYLSLLLHPLEVSRFDTWQIDVTKIFSLFCN